MFSFLSYFLLFITYSFLGWVVETVYCSYLEKRFVNRGFLIGPYCPIYGTASVLIIVFLSKYYNGIFVLFSVSVILAGLLEYVTSYLLEKIFKLSLWDYSNQKFNIRGRVCLENLIYFGILSIILIKLVNPVVQKLYDYIPYYLLWTITIISLIIFSLDLVLTIVGIYDIKNIANKILNLDELADVRESIVKTVQVDIGSKTESVKQSFLEMNSELINKIQSIGKVKFNYIHKRFMNAFPNIKSIENNHYIEYLKNLFHR